MDYILSLFDDLDELNCYMQIAERDFHYLEIHTHLPEYSIVVNTMPGEKLYIKSNLSDKFTQSYERAHYERIISCMAYYLYVSLIETNFLREAETFRSDDDVREWIYNVERVLSKENTNFGDYSRRRFQLNAHHRTKHQLQKTTRLSYIDVPPF